VSYVIKSSNIIDNSYRCHHRRSNSSSNCLDIFITDLQLPFILTELKLLRSADSFRRDVKTFLFDSVYGHQDTDCRSVGGAIQVSQLQLLVLCCF